MNCLLNLGDEGAFLEMHVLQHRKGPTDVANEDVLYGMRWQGLLESNGRRKGSTRDNGVVHAIRIGKLDVVHPIKCMCAGCGRRLECV